MTLIHRQLFTFLMISYTKQHPKSTTKTQFLWVLRLSSSPKLHVLIYCIVLCYTSALFVIASSLAIPKIPVSMSEVIKGSNYPVQSPEFTKHVPDKIAHNRRWTTLGMAMDCQKVEPMHDQQLDFVTGTYQYKMIFSLLSISDRPRCKRCRDGSGCRLICREDNFNVGSTT